MNLEFLPDEGYDPHRRNEATVFCPDGALEILGAFGSSTELSVERYYCDAKSDPIGYRKANR